MSKLVVFDFDNTLFPTSLVRAAVNFVADGGSIDMEKVKRAFVAFDGFLARKLTAMRKDKSVRFMIVTQATQKWFDHCLEEYLKNTLMFLTSAVRSDPNIIMCNTKNKVRAVNGIDHEVGVARIVSCGDQDGDRDVAEHCGGKDSSAFFIKVAMPVLPISSTKDAICGVRTAVEVVGEMFQALDLVLTQN